MKRLLRRTLAALTLAGLLTAGTALADDLLTPADTTWGAHTTTQAPDDTTW